jgi:hypothetical protein
MARPRRLEGSLQMFAAIRVAGDLPLAAEMEARLARIANRPPAIAALEGRDCFALLRHHLSGYEPLARSPQSLRLDGIEITFM